MNGLKSVYLEKAGDKAGRIGSWWPEYRVSQAVLMAGKLHEVQKTIELLTSTVTW